MAKILIADDEPHIRELLKVTLSGGGHQVVEAADGQEAWEKIPGERPEMLLIDLNMPRLDGLGLCRKVRGSEEWRGLPILMLTVRDLVEDQVRGYDNGADEYLTKPFDGKLLLARVKALLSRSHRRAD